ncbi:hypothetical protein HY388_01035 [Candidatus Daviesbacteria bacterium]|nr:hypothetical protein [Candidatus Daviesbacteria bacterium]
MVSKKFKRHLAIFTGDTIDKILSGQKTIESRFSRQKIAPFGQVAKGDLILMKQSGGKLRGQFLVDKTIFFDHPSTQDVQLIKNKYAQEIAVDEKFWLRHEGACYITLIFITHPTAFLVEPFKIPKKDLRGWVVL